MNFSVNVEPILANDILCYELAAVCDISRKMLCMFLYVLYPNLHSLMTSTDELVKNLYNDHICDLTSLFLAFRQAETEHQSLEYFY